MNSHERGNRFVGEIRFAIMVVLLPVFSLTTIAEAVEAPGAPGSSSSWKSGAKQGIGTSTTSDSKVWYTLGNGILNEVYYPQVDLPNVEDLQFIVSDGSSFIDLERDATDHQVQLLDPQVLIYRQVNTKADRYRITKTYVTDVDRPTLLIETRFEVLSERAMETSPARLWPRPASRRCRAAIAERPATAWSI